MQGGVADLGACDQGAETTRAACEASNGGAGVFTSAGAPGGTGTVSAVQSCAPNGLLRHGPQRHSVPTSIQMCSKAMYIVVCIVEHVGAAVGA